MPFKDKDKKLEWQRKYREKKRQSQKPVETKQYSDNLPSESIVKPVETDCQKLRRLRLGTRKNPDDGFFCDDHLKNCINCQNWYTQHKHEDEWDFEGVNLWGDVEKAGQSEVNEQKAGEQQLAKEGFDYKRSSNPSENVLGVEGSSKELDRHFFDDSNQDFRKTKQNRKSQTEESEPNA